MTEEAPEKGSRKLMSRGEWIRILALAGVLVIMAIVFAVFLKTAKIPTPAARKSVVPIAEKVVAEPVPEELDEVGEKEAGEEAEAETPSEESVAEAPAVQPEEPTEDAEGEGPPILKHYPEIDMSKGDVLLGDVKDRTFSYSEPAFYWVVKTVSGLPPEVMQPGKEKVSYSRLMQVPRSYRGKPVTIEGTYAMVDPWRVPVKAAGVDVLYTCFLKADVPGEIRPVAVVVTLEDPMTYLWKGDRVAVQGYFYKVWSYRTGDGVEHMAPLLIARRLELVKHWTAVTGGGVPTSLVWMLGILIGFVIILMMVFFVLKSLTKRTANANRYRRTGRP